MFKWLDTIFTEIEQLNQQHDSFNMHKKIKQEIGLNRKRSLDIITKKTYDIYRREFVKMGRICHRTIPKSKKGKQNKNSRRHWTTNYQRGNK